MPRRRKVLVCGATGFIGRNVAEALARHEHLDVVGVRFRSKPFRHPRLKFVRADLRSAADVRRVLRGADVLIHAAATTSGSKDIVEKPYLHVTDNALMGSLLFRAAYEAKLAHVLFLSCSVMYHSSPAPLKESDFDPARGLHPKYFGVGWTKLYLERMCEFYSRLGPARYTVARHSNIYGPYDKFDLERSHVFGATVAKVLGSRDGKVTVWGSGEEARDLLHVSDLVAFVEAALERQKEKYGLYNVGSGRPVTVKDLVRKIITASGRDLTVAQDLSKPTIPTTLALDSAKAASELGWRPKVALEEGIRMTLEWCRSRREPAGGPR